MCSRDNIPGQHSHSGIGGCAEPEGSEPSTNRLENGWRVSARIRPVLSRRIIGSQAAGSSARLRLCLSRSVSDSVSPNVAIAMLWWSVAIVAGVAAYVLSSGVAFVVMYRVGPRYHRYLSRLATAVYAPLEALAQRSCTFGRWYTEFHWWMYRRLVHDYRHDGPPPPPPSLW